MAMKKTATKVAKSSKKAVKTVAVKKSAAVKKGVVKKAVAVKKPAAKKVVAVKKPVAKKTAAVKKPVAKKAATVKKAAVKKVAVKTPAAKKVAAVKKPAAKTAVVNKSRAPVAKKTAEAPVTRSAVPVRRRLGKVAVAVAAKSQTPIPRGKVKVVPYKTEKGSGRPIVPKGYTPSEDEEYMSPLQLEYFRQRLLQWREDLVEESKQTIENLKDEVRDVGDEAERATRETENSLELRTRDRYRKLISKIDSTLKRVDSGEYGFCADTGEEIGLERMDARLTAERTLDAQERWEHLRKQMGD
ncbi:RNA polymerase-binding protein DksA [Lysobacter sp. A286]